MIRRNTARLLALGLFLSLLVALPGRARADGELDPSFATEGVLRADLGDPADAVGDVAIAPGGRIIVLGDVSGIAGRDLVLAAFTPAGVPVASFGENGRVVADFGGDERADALAIDANGSIVAVGTRTKDGVAELVLLRYDADGKLDQSFNGNGRRVLSFTDGAQNASGGVAFDLVGRIVVGGTRTGAAGSVFAVARLLPSGALDTTFNASGKRFVDFGVENRTNAFGAAVAVQDDGKIVIAGTRVGAGGTDFAVARLLADGSFDASFDGTGKTAIDFGGLDTASAVALRPAGGIAIAGVRETTGGDDVAVVVLRDDGQEDPSFKGNGKATTDLGADDAARAIVAQPDGKLVAVGERMGPNGRDFAVVRYNVDGSLDAALDEDGKLRVDLASGSEDAGAGVALQADGRIVVAGTSAIGNERDLGIVRLLSPSGVSAGVLEIPANGTHQSGVGLISGWLCSAPSVSVRLDGGPLIDTSYGTGRADTQGACGDSNNGFGLLFNWGLLGDGPHVIRAFAGGTQFARAVFHVQTLGTPFLRGASGKYTLPGFPNAGGSVDVTWAEALQRFVISGRVAGTSAAGAPRTMVANAVTTAVPPATSAAVAGVLENPVPGSFQSGVGLISGWICNASSVLVRIDNRPPVRAAYGTNRSDTQGVCGDSNNGFGLLFNWGLLGDGPHTIDVRADGMPIGTATFTVTTLGTSFLRGAAGSYTLPDFPAAGSSVDVSWDEGQQGFVIVGRD